MYNRTILPKILDHLESEKITILIWPRQVGKTTLMKICQKKRESEQKPVLYLTLERPWVKELLDGNPENILQLLPVTSEKILVCIDEIQYLKDPTNFLKLIYDEHRDRIKLFVTGSSAFYIDRHFKDSLAWRKEIFELFPLSFVEFLDWKDYKNIYFSINTQESIYALFDEYLRFGGYPELVLMNNEEKKIEYLNGLVSSYIKKDVVEAWVRHSEKYFQLLQLLSEQTGKLVNMSELANILWINSNTVQEYLYIMQKSFHIALLRPYAKNIRKEIIRMPKVYFYDAWLRNICLDIFDPIIKRQDKWECLEQYLWQYLRQQYSDSKLQFWRDKQGHEVDFILNSKDAREIKRDKKYFKLWDYKSFTNSYPHIPLICMDRWGILERVINV